MIFDEFRQSDRTAARGFGGLGLGLAVCKRLVELHGGEIGVISSGEERSGSTFYFRLPALDEQRAPLSASALSQALTRLGLGTPTAGRTIVIVDDEPGMLDVHARLVQTHWPAYHVIKARGGQAAVEIIQEILPDLVLLDLKMPEVDGFAVLERLRAQPTTRDIPVMVLTNQVLSEQDMARLSQGVTAVLGKGLFKPAETLAHMEAALAGSPRTGQETRRLVRKAMAYIHAHCAEPLTRTAIAQHVGVSGSYLARCFRHDLGMAPMVYLARCRVQQAQQLLAASDQSITEVALAVGFASASAFTQAFERETGLTPRAYRQGKRAG
jgi:AraC-like DNA-binding protein